MVRWLEDRRSGIDHEDLRSGQAALRGGRFGRLLCGPATEARPVS
jgi:hypothetical protein